MDVTKLKAMNACNEAIKWASKQRNRQQAWDDCPRGDWMLWLLGRRIKRQGSQAHRKLVLCACAVARTAIKHVPAGEDRPQVAIETAEAWANRADGVTLASVSAAAAAAYGASAASASAADAAWAAAAARTKSHRETADIVRTFYPKAPRI